MAVNSLSIRNLRRAEIYQAATVVAQAMHDTPLNEFCLGPDQDRRVSIVTRLVASNLQMMWCPPLIASHQGKILGMVALAPPGTCHLPYIQACRRAATLRMTIPELYLDDLSNRLGVWSKCWASHDDKEPHWHLGPCAVIPELQGNGIGTRLMGKAIQVIQRSASPKRVYLETDQRRNLVFYEHLGFHVTGVVDVWSFPTWLMTKNVTARR